jgi:AraC family cel operon transcriptional repressor
MVRLFERNFMAKGGYHFGQSRHASVLNRKEPHCHDFHELFWIEDGRGWHWINGEKRLLGPGTVILIRAPDAHSFSTEPDESMEMVNVAFGAATWNYLRRRYFDKRPDYFRKSHISEREFALPAGEFAEVRRLGRELSPQPRDRFPIERFLLNLLSVIESVQPSAGKQPAPEWLLTACREIQERRNFERGTLGFSELAGKSPEHVAREVRKYFGKTPTDLVNDARLTYAATRLATTNERIIDIALDCGFENLGHFYTIFGKKFGASPRQYRLQQQRIVGPVA